jgi:hypothetical protein
MNTSNTTDRISAFLDAELTDVELREFEADLLVDPALVRACDMEAALRSNLRKRSTHLRTGVPLDVERSIRLALAQEVENATQRDVAPTSWYAALANAIRKPLIAIPTGIAAVAVIVLMIAGRSESPSVARMTPKVDLYEASYANFNKIVKGEIKLAKATANQNELREFFANEGVKHQIFFPAIAAELKGGVVSHHDGVHFAHLVYGAGEHLVYIFEVDEASIEKNEVAMKTAIAQDLRESRWHWEERPGIGTMFVWESNNVICSAVSDLATQDLSALFTLEKL